MAKSIVKSHSRSTKGKGNTTVKRHGRTKKENKARKNIVTAHIGAQTGSYFDADKIGKSLRGTKKEEIKDRRATTDKQYGNRTALQNGRWLSKLGTDMENRTSHVKKVIASGKRKGKVVLDKAYKGEKGKKLFKSIGSAYRDVKPKLPK